MGKTGTGTLRPSVVIPMGEDAFRELLSWAGSAGTEARAVPQDWGSRVWLGCVGTGEGKDRK